MKKIYLSIFIVVLLISSCSNKEVMDENTGEELSEELIVNFLNKIYTIDDPLDYENEIETMFKDLSEGKDNFLGYDEFCSENGLASVLGNRMHGMYREVALAKNFTMSLSDLEYNVTYRKDADGSLLNQYKTMVYDYTATLLLEYEDGKTELIEEEGGINVKFIEGEWKVDVFKLKVFNDIWTQHINNEG
jgi:archaellin